MRRSPCPTSSWHALHALPAADRRSSERRDAPGYSRNSSGSDISSSMVISGTADWSAERSA